MPRPSAGFSSRRALRSRNAALALAMKVRAGRPAQSCARIMIAVRFGATVQKHLARGLIRDHIQAFGAAGITKLLRRDATALGTPGTFGQFDLIFLDPPYNQGLGEKALVELATNGWIAPGATIVWEEAAEAEVTIPPGFELDDTREYGAAAVRFLTFG